jgi:hypothetical protein
MRVISSILVLGLGVAVVPGAGAESVVDERLSAYRQQGGADFSAARGRAMWTEVRGERRPGQAQSCADCHGSDITRAGKHVRTGKPIEPLAPSVNPVRLSDTASIEKWLLRNCKGTWGRECSAQEKGDLLLFIRQQ